MLTLQVQTCIGHTVEFALFLFPIPLKSKRAQSHHDTPGGPTIPVRASAPTHQARPSAAQPPSPTSPPAAAQARRRLLAPNPTPGRHESDPLTDTPTPHVASPTCQSLHPPTSLVRHTRPDPRTPTRSGASTYMNAHLSAEFRPNHTKTRSSPPI